MELKEDYDKNIMKTLKNLLWSNNKYMNSNKKNQKHTKALTLSINSILFLIFVFKRNKLRK